MEGSEDSKKKPTRKNNAKASTEIKPDTVAGEKNEARKKNKGQEKRPYIRK